jgi:hypothetical protein
MILQQPTKAKLFFTNGRWTRHAQALRWSEF